jgi:hypothetical protein
MSHCQECADLIAERKLLYGMLEDREAKEKALEQRVADLERLYKSCGDGLEAACKQLSLAVDHEQELEHQLAALTREAEGLRRDRDSLRYPLSALMGAINEGLLVRDISRDHEPGWAMRQLPLVMMLNGAQKALDAALDPQTTTASPTNPPSSPAPNRSS